MRRAVVPGTFDPITLGHLDVITRAAKVFDEIVVAVALSPGKHTLFSHEERVELVREATLDLANVRVEGFDELLVRFADRVGASSVVKGLRAITDFEYEFQLTALNYAIHGELETFFIMSPPAYMYLSSSIVRELASLHGDLTAFVPPCAKRALEERFREDQ